MASESLGGERMAAPKFEPEAYTVGWICALPIELAMVRAMLDSTHAPLASQPRHDENHYHLGEIGKHKIVITCLAEYGTTNAAAAAKSMQATFGQLRFGLLVGIGGGAPSPQVDIRLGDVAVSLPTEQHGGVLQYDLGRMEVDGFHRKGSLNRPPKLLLGIIPTMRTTRGISKDIFERASKVLRDEDNDEDWAQPSELNDTLFKAEYKHVGKNPSCGECDGRVLRDDRKQNWPKIHYGNIASGNTVVKSPEMRDRLAEEDDVICVEMEAAGIMNDFPCLVIRGISDYSDSHKNSKWQPYAAAVAAAYAKKLILEIPLTAIQAMETIRKSHCNVPFGRNKDFIGRDSELRYLITNLNPEDENDCQRVAISGLGGIGKTQIALEAAFQIQKKISDCSVFWVPAIDSASFERAYREIGQKLQIPGINDDKADIKSLVKTCLSQENFGRWLMVIDNADDFKMLFDRADENDEGFSTPALVDCLPFSRRGSILFTTRNYQVAVELAGNSIVEVKEMSQDESRKLLGTSLVNKSLTKEKEIVLRLLDLLGNLPLAIKQAAAFLNKNMSTSVSDYLEIYNSNDEGLIELLSQDFNDHGRYLQIKNPIASTWLISFRQIQRTDQLATRYLCFMSCVAQLDIPLSLLPPARKFEEFKSIGTLKAYAFITERSERNSYDVHRLVRLVARNWLKNENTLSSWSLQTLKRVAEVFPFFEHNKKNECTLLLPHTQYVLEFQMLSGNSGESSRKLLYNVGQYFSETGKYNEAEIMHRRALELKEEVLGPEHPSTLDSMNNLAEVLRSQGKYEEAETMHRQTLELREEVLGPEHPSTLGSMNNLALVLRSQGKYEEAETMHRQTLELKEEVLGPEHPSTLDSMNNLAEVLRSQGKYEEAETMHRRALELREEVLGPEHPSTLGSMNNLALVLRSQGKYEEAETMHRQTLELKEEVLGPEHPSTLGSMNNLALVLDSQGKYEEAETMHRQTLELTEEVLGPEHPSTLGSMNNLAEVLDSQGKYEEAEAMHRQTLELKEEVLGPEHLSTLDSMNNLALVLRSQGKYEEAEAMHRRALELREEVLGPEHPSTLSSINNLAEVLRSQGKYEEAEAMHRQTLELREEVLGPEHPSTLGSMNNLALVLRSQGKYEEAETMHRQTLELTEEVLGPEHPSTLGSMNNLAEVLDSQGKYEEAEAMHRQTLELKEEVLGPEHPSTLDSMNNLALVLRSQGKYEEAEAMHRRALELREEVLGPEHPSTLSSMNNLAEVLRSQGKYEEAEAMHRQTLELREEVLGPEHPSTLGSMNNLALVLRSQGKYEEAETMHRQTLELTEEVLGPEHPSTLGSMNNLAEVLRSQGKYEEAETMRKLNERNPAIGGIEDVRERKKTFSTSPLQKVTPLPSSPPALKPKPTRLSLYQRHKPPEIPLKPPYLKGV